MTLVPPSRRRKAVAPATPAVTLLSPPKIERLPARTGNQDMQRLLGRRGVQPKLQVGGAHDPLEAEADSVADRVLAQRPAGAVSGVAPQVQRRARPGASGGNAAGGAGGAGGGAAGGAAPPGVERALAGPGRPLEPAVASDMGQRFGQDFSAVRVHTDSAAAASAHAIQAHAYTAGRDIVFGAGRYQPYSESGRHLLAHELAHTLQQGGDHGLVQREFAVEPTVADPAAVALTVEQLNTAIRLDRVVFTDPEELAAVRDIVGIPREPTVVDADLVNAIGRYQAAFGLGVDGMVGPGTAAQLEREATASADALEQAPTGTPLRRLARRMHLRSMVSRRTGLLSHQGFVGDDANPEGAVTVRLGDRFSAAAPNTISLEYTGENADRVDWLQFINIQMFARVPGTAAPVFNTGNVGTTGGPVNYSDAATTNWFVDAEPANPSPLYNDSGANTRGRSRRLAMFDAPGGAHALPVAQAFAAGAAAGATTVTLNMRFEAYVIRANRARYRVAWTGATVYNIAAGTSSAIMYRQGATASVSNLRGVHRTALLAEYPGNLIR